MIRATKRKQLLLSPGEFDLAADDVSKVNAAICICVIGAKQRVHATVDFKVGTNPRKLHFEVLVRLPLARADASSDCKVAEDQARRIRTALKSVLDAMRADNAHDARFFLDSVPPDSGDVPPCELSIRT